MHSLPLRLVIFQSIAIVHCRYVIRGEKTRYSFFCPIPNGHWYGPNNQSIVSNSDRYEIQYSFDSTQLIIDYITLLHEGEYICQNNQTNDIIERYQLRLGTLNDILLAYFILTFSILIFIPIFWFLGKKYSGIKHQ
ncbi:unnamed protein product [Rotaria socialis]|uniref:Ig-like domain-containing protein n=2 Tax=Rotaria socialis TaxID=392032 RepID=A0A817PX65_9BILA|nr:unnamed protein product [Rotaria socialis]CAF3397971.1 unnamed protein product [Rotaria socialis]CAF3508338.1 unnamed protein product [Rotaria socialis]CAF3697162.1 unnamed protein product [Rotaria socialis]CAF4297124.1 unnamed protein product [Rotaria socialis]